MGPGPGPELELPDQRGVRRHAKKNQITSGGSDFFDTGGIQESGLLAWLLWERINALGDLMLPSLPETCGTGMPQHGVSKSTVSADSEGEGGKQVELTSADSDGAACTARAYSLHSACFGWLSLSMTRWKSVHACLHVQTRMCLCVEEGNKMEVLNWVQRAEMIQVLSMKNGIILCCKY